MKDRPCEHEWAATGEPQDNARVCLKCGVGNRPTEQESSKPESYFRGLRGIMEIRDEKLRRLAEWMKANRPSCTAITLKRKDYDLIARYPKAAGPAGFTVKDGVVTYEGFTLHWDKTPERYQKP